MVPLKVLSRPAEQPADLKYERRITSQTTTAMTMDLRDMIRCDCPSYTQVEQATTASPCWRSYRAGTEKLRTVEPNGKKPPSMDNYWRSGIGASLCC